MFVRLSLAAGLITATVVIQALFMSVGLNTSSGSKSAGLGPWLENLPARQ